MPQSLESFLDELRAPDSIKDHYRTHGVNWGWIVMFVISLANIATLLTGTIINVAIPEIMGAFGIGQDKAQWLATGFLASSTLTMLMNSWLTQNFGIRWTMMVAMMVFVVGSILGGVAPNLDIMIFSRILQGAATGVIVPMNMAIVFHLFPSRMQGRAMGITTVAAVMAPAVGPVLGGVLIDSLSWRYVFLLGVPVSILVLPLTLLYLPQRDPEDAKPSLDWVGLVLMSIAISATLIGLSNGQSDGWTSNGILSWFAAAVLSITFFIYWENHIKHPLLDLRVFSYYRFTVFSIVAAITGAGLYGSTYIIPLFLQIAQNMSPTDSGMMLLPSGILMGALFPFVGMLADRGSHRILMSIGIVIFAYSNYLMVSSDVNTSYWTFCFWMLIGRVGVAFLAPVVNLSSMQGLPMEYFQQGAGAVNFLRQLGGAFGVNLLALALNQRTSFHRDVLFSTQSYGNSDSLALLGDLQRTLVPAGLTESEQEYVAFQTLSRLVYDQAMVLAFQDGFLMIGIVFILTLIPVWMLRTRHFKTPKLRSV
jgi:DHA2 family multidrug resistance protein